MAKTKDHKAHEIQVQNFPDWGLALLISLKPVRRNSGFGCLSRPEQQSREQISVGLVLNCICVEISPRQEVTRRGDSLHGENQRGFGETMWDMTDVTELLTYKSVCASVTPSLIPEISSLWVLCNLNRNIKKKPKTNKQKKSAIAAWNPW